MTPLHGIACFYNVGFGARAVSRKTSIYFIFYLSDMGEEERCNRCYSKDCNCLDFNNFYMPSMKYIGVLRDTARAPKPTS